jgi:plasmid stability protein
VSSGQSVTATGQRMKRFTFDVPESLHRRIKATCAARGKDMADEMRRILQEQFPE